MPRQQKAVGGPCKGRVQPPPIAGLRCRAEPQIDHHITVVVVVDAMLHPAWGDKNHFTLNDALYEALYQYSDNLEILAIGPLTNIVVPDVKYNAI